MSNSSMRATFASWTAALMARPEEPSPFKGALGEDPASAHSGQRRDRLRGGSGWVLAGLRQHRRAGANLGSGQQHRQPHPDRPHQRGASVGGSPGWVLAGLHQRRRAGANLGPDHRRTTHIAACRGPLVPPRLDVHDDRSRRRTWPLFPGALPWEAIPIGAPGIVASVGSKIGQVELMRRRPCRVPPPRSGFAGFRFPSEVITVAVRWYLPAPRGASSYPRHSWEELEGRFLGPMAYLDAKPRGDSSLPEKQRSCQAYEARCCGTRVIRLKLDCLNPNLQMMQPTVRRKDA